MEKAKVDVLAELDPIKRGTEDLVLQMVDPEWIALCPDAPVFRVLRSLERQGLIAEEGGRWRLSDSGRRVLGERYLNGQVLQPTSWRMRDPSVGCAFFTTVYSLEGKAVLEAQGWVYDPENLPLPSNTSGQKAQLP